MPGGYPIDSTELARRLGYREQLDFNRAPDELIRPALRQFPAPAPPPPSPAPTPPAVTVLKSLPVLTGPSSASRVDPRYSRVVSVIADSAASAKCWSATDWNALH
jgi:hypothetical protein